MHVLNESSIKKYLRGFAGGDEQLGNHLIATLFGPLKVRRDNLDILNEAPPRWPDKLAARFRARAEPWATFREDPALGDRVRHIADWIGAAMANREDWLDKTDDKGRPLRLVAIRSLDEAARIADSALRVNTTRVTRADILRTGHDEIAAGHIEPVMELENGFCIVRLLTPQALDRESAVLGHCIGQGSYDHKLAGGAWEFYSLRDARNKPHATLDVHAAQNMLLQCKGAQDKPPVEKYLPYLQVFIKDRDFDLNTGISNTGLLKKNGVYYDPFNLPDHFTWEKDFIIQDFKRPLILPRYFSVGGELWIHRCADVDMSDTRALSVARGLWIDSCPTLDRLPARLFVGAHLHLSRCPRIVRLPDELSVAREIVTDFGWFHNAELAQDAFDQHIAASKAPPSPAPG